MPFPNLSAILVLWRMLTDVMDSDETLGLKENRYLFMYALHAYTS